MWRCHDWFTTPIGKAIVITLQRHFSLFSHFDRREKSRDPSHSLGMTELRSRSCVVGIFSCSRFRKPAAEVLPRSGFEVPPGIAAPYCMWFHGVPIHGGNTGSPFRHFPERAGPSSLRFSLSEHFLKIVKIQTVASCSSLPRQYNEQLKGSEGYQGNERLYLRARSIRAMVASGKPVTLGKINRRLSIVLI